MNCSVCQAKVDLPLCGKCRRQFGRWLAEVPELVHQLTIVVTRQHRYGDTSGPRSAGTPLVFHAGASDARQALAATLVSIARSLAAPGFAEPVLAGVPRVHLAPLPRDADKTPGVLGRVEEAIPRSQAATAALSAAQWLTVHLDGLCRDDRAGQWWHTVRDTVDQAGRMCVPAPPRWYAGPCDQCETDLLAEVDDKGQPVGPVVECPKCRAEHELEGRREWLMGVAKGYLVRRSVALLWARILMGASVPRGTFDAWVNRRKLLPAGENGEEHPLYRFADVCDLVELWQTSRRRKVS